MEPAADEGSWFVIIHKDLLLLRPDLGTCLARGNIVGMLLFKAQVTTPFCHSKSSTPWPITGIMCRISFPSTLNLPGIDKEFGRRYLDFL